MSRAHLAPPRSPGPSRLALACLRAVTSATRAEAIVGDVVEDALRRARPGGAGRSRFQIETAVWRHVAAESFERAPGLLRMGGFVARDAWRGLRSAPATTIFGFSILAVGIAAATVTFSIVDGILLRPLPYPDAERLVRVELRMDRLQPFSNLSPLPVFLYERIKTQAPGFTAVVAERGGGFALRTSGDPEPVAGVLTTASLFEVLKVQPALGQPFTSANEVEGSDAVALIGDDLWRRRFGADPAVVGRRLELTSHTVTVLGVMPPGFAYPIDGDRRTEIWMPFVAPADERSGAQLSRYLSVTGRLAPETSVKTVEAQVDAILGSIVPTGPSRIDGAVAVVRSLQDVLFGSVRNWMLLALGAVALVMLIACANVANLLLGRATERTREIALRSSMGASRRLLMTSLLAESVLLSVAAATIGILAASWGLDAARALLPAGIARASTVAVDFRVLVAAVSAAIVTGILAGVVPAWQATSRDVVTLLKDQSAATTGRARWRATFLVAQVAFVGMLLVTTALVVTSFVRVTRWDLGFDRRHLVTTFASGLNAPVMNVLRALQDTPGVVAAGAFLSGSAPLARAGGFGGGASGTRIERLDGPAGRKSADALFLGTSPGYFAAAGIRILRGRDFTAEDLGKTDRLILDADVARSLFPDIDPVGAVVRWADADATVIGVVAVVQDYGPDRDPNPAIYLPARPNASGYGFLVRTRSDPTPIIPAIQATLDRLRKPSGEPVRARPLEEAFRFITANRRVAATLMSTFGVLALLIGAAGIYGVMTSMVVQRTREFGIRVALGASTRTILSGVVARAGRQLLAGLAIGLPAGFFAARAVESVFFNVQSTEPGVYATVAGITLAVGLLAAIVPARRAARVDPLVSLRHE